jgi:GT2 family glycosyltransferase
VAETTVIIPNWNGRHLLGRCLDALHAQTYRDFDIIVVDNGSTDGSVAYLREHFPEVHVIANEENRGFAAATNQGIRATSSRLIATLNNDTEVDPVWLAALVAAMETEMESASGVGMCASAMLFAQRPEMINSAGIAVDRAGIAWDRLGGAPLAALGDAPVEVFGPCAGAALYRRAMLEEVGLFDEDFFAYMEDVDLAWRARVAGWRCLFVPQARLLHHHSATGKEGSPFKSFHLGRNKVWLLLKNYPVRELWHHVPLVLLYDLVAVLYALLARLDVHALRGRLAGWRAAPRMWRQRPRRDPDRAIDVDLLAPLVWPWRVPWRYRHIN